MQIASGANPGNVEEAEWGKFMTRLPTTAALFAALVLALAPASATSAATPWTTQEQTAAPRVNISLSGEAAPAAEQPDQALYLTALTDFNERGFAALGPHLAGLRTALSRAPAAYPVMSEVDGGWLIRTDARDEAMTLARAIGEIEQGRGGGEVKVVVVPNTYPRIAFLLGSEALERRAFEEAHRYLDAGLALQPLDRLLLNEKLVVLHGERRWEEAYLMLKDAFAVGDPLLTADPAHLQRRLGYTLVELGRLREAREAYDASLVAEPGNAIALNELKYIDDIEAGRPTSDEVQITAPLAPRPEGEAPASPGP